jgi:GTP-binding protein EngB required for normal cell division
VPVAIAATKMDKLNRSEQRETLKAFEKYGALVLPFSVPTHLGDAEVWKTIRDWVQPS